MEKISRTDSVKNEVLRIVKEERNIIPTIKGRKVNWIGRNCLLKHIFEGKIQRKVGYK